MGRGVTQTRYIGTAVKRIEDRPLLTGAGRFVDDLRFAGTLEAAFVRSPHAHAVIRAIDASAARSQPGVHAVFTLAESLGAVESLIEHPGVMTHASAAGSPLEVSDNLVRLSVGIESSGDLVADLEQALGCV